MKFATKLIRHYPPHLKHVATLPWEIKNSNFLKIFSKYRRKCKHIAFLSPLNFVIHPQILILSVFNIASFPHTDCIVLLLVYFYDQFVAPQIRHSRRYCSVCQQSIWNSAMRTSF